MTDRIGGLANYLHEEILFRLEGGHLRGDLGYHVNNFISLEVKNRETAHAVRQRLYETTDVQQQVTIEPRLEYMPNWHWKLKVKRIWEWKQGFVVGQFYEHKRYHGTWKLQTTEPVCRFVQVGNSTSHVITLEHPEQQFYDRQLGNRSDSKRKEGPERDLSPKRKAPTEEKSEKHLQAYEKLKAEADERSNEHGLLTGSRYVVCPHCLSVDQPQKIPWIHPHQMDWNTKVYSCATSTSDRSSSDSIPLVKTDV